MVKADQVLAPLGCRKVEEERSLVPAVSNNVKSIKAEGLLTSALEK